MGIGMKGEPQYSHELDSLHEECTRGTFCPLSPLSPLCVLGFADLTLPAEGLINHLR